MPFTATSTDIVNQALMYMGGNQPPVTGTAPNFDDSPSGQAAKQFYTPIVQTVGRQFEWDMARNQFTLVLTPNGSSAPQWPYEYFYPSPAIDIWQLLPAVLTDPNNPLPTNWVVGNTLVASVQTKVIWANVQNALAVLNNSPTEAIWDSLYRESVVRLLASVMSMALAGRPDSAQAYLESYGAFEQIGEGRDS